MPIAIEGQEGKRSEVVEVSFDPSPAQMYQQARREHLRDRDDVASDGATRHHQHHCKRRYRNRTTEKYRGP